MALQVYKVNLTGYVIRDPDVMDDPNNIDLDVVLDLVTKNSFECTMDLIDSIGDVGCDCTECTCGASSTVPLMMNLGEPGTSANTSVPKVRLLNEEESMTI